MKQMALNANFTDIYVISRMSISNSNGIFDAYWDRLSFIGQVTKSVYCEAAESFGKCELRKICPTPSGTLL